MKTGDKKPMPRDPFIERLRVRIEADPDLNQRNVALKAGLDESLVRKLLAGKIASPRLYTIERICRGAFGQSVEEFMADPKTQDEREILRLIGRLSVPERLQLLGFAKGLVASSRRAQVQPISEIQ